MFRDRFLQEEKTLYEALAPCTRSFLMFPSIAQSASQPSLLRYFVIEIDIMTLRTARKEGQRGILREFGGSQVQLDLAHHKATCPRLRWLLS